MRTLLQLLWSGIWVVPSAAVAGMPSPLPTDVARVIRLNESGAARLQAISFFLVVLLVSALVVRWLWNSLGHDFPRLPRLSYARSLAVVGLWGTAFLVVLTMIATAREMMTPGVWQKKELLYHIPDRPVIPSDPERIAERKEQLRRIQTALWHYAACHEGKLPESIESSGIPAHRWQPPGRPGLRYLYTSGLRLDRTPEDLVREPAVYGSESFLLRTDGEIRLVPRARKSMAQAEKPE